MREHPVLVIIAVFLPLTTVLFMYYLFIDGVPQLSLSFLTETASRIDPASSGIGPAIVGTLWLMAVCAAFSDSVASLSVA